MNDTNICDVKVFWGVKISLEDIMGKRSSPYGLGKNLKFVASDDGL